MPTIRSGIHSYLLRFPTIFIRMHTHMHQCSRHSFNYNAQVVFADSVITSLHPTVLRLARNVLSIMELDEPLSMYHTPRGWAKVFKVPTTVFLLPFLPRLVFRTRWSVHFYVDLKIYPKFPSLNPSTCKPRIWMDQRQSTM